MGEDNTFNWEDILMSPAKLTSTYSGLISKYKNEDVITLRAETTISKNETDNMSPAAMDKMIRKELVEQLVNQILEEDLIVIETNVNDRDPLNQCQTFRTKLKILQER